MKRIFRSIMACLLAIVLTVGSAPLAGFVGLELPDWLDFSVSSVEAEAATHRGKCGYYAYWKYDSITQILTITGTGEISSYSWNNDKQSYERPWEQYVKNIRHIIVDDGITVIGMHAFDRHRSVLSVQLPNSLEDIYYRAFYDCINLTDVYYEGSESEWNAISIGTNNDSLLNAIRYYTIIGTCGENLTYILTKGELVISGTGAMTSWSNHTDVPWHSYRNNIKSVTISNGVTSIGKYAFYYNENLKSITIPDGLTSIGSAAFSNCYKLANITLPDSVTYVYDYVFSDCNSLVSVTIGNGVKSIGYAAFEGCNSLLHIIIPDGVSYIGQYAFSFCESLNSVTIPDSVTQIDYSAFGGCYDIADVYYMGSEGQWSGIKFGSFNNPLLDATIHYNHVHFSKNIEESVDPTCNEGGYKKCVCVCGYRFTEEISALGHDIVIDKAAEPTCTEMGLTEGQHCSRCNGATTTQEVIPALNHKDTLVKVAAQVPTCTEIGWDAYEYCTACTYTTYEEKAALKHDIVIDKAAEPTCTETGLTEGQHCSRCDDMTVAQEVIPALNHKDTLVKVAAQVPTCTEIGWEAYEYCTACTYTTYEEKAALKHDIVIDKAVEPTCTETGLTEGHHCSRCEDATVAQEIVPMTKHTAITTENDSTNHWGVCSCGEKLNLEGHKYGSDNVCDVCEYEKVITLKMSIRKPSTTTISYGDSIILHADMNEALPSGWTVKWTADNGNFSYSANGETCTITPSKSGDTTFIVTVYDENENEISKDTQTMKSKAGFFDKFAAFFRKLFGMTKIIQQSINF